jgi:enolase-phosphatase E1
VIRFAGRAVLLDIEGTTSSISFVYDVMFPFVRRELESFLGQNWSSDAVQDACDQIARDAGHSSLRAWCSGTDADRRSTVSQEVTRLMDGDVKATGLKQLQGVIWKQGFESGELKAHLFDDVPAALSRWNEANLDVRVYSSGSVQAQQLFFGHTLFGNLRPLLRGHYDTTTGPKREAASYRTISNEFGLPPSQILFLSDVVAELNAARSAGMQTALCCRLGNATVDSDEGHDRIREFSEVVIR